MFFLHVQSLAVCTYLRIKIVLFFNVETKYIKCTRWMITFQHLFQMQIRVKTGSKYVTVLIVVSYMTYV